MKQALKIILAILFPITIPLLALAVSWLVFWDILDALVGYIFDRSTIKASYGKDRGIE